VILCGRASVWEFRCSETARLKERTETDAWDSRLHPTQYPWEHQKWNKTFDHQA